MRQLKHEPGTFLRVPLPDGSFGYGRMLEDPYIAFYDYRTKNPSEDLDTIEAKPLLFSQTVRVPSNRWKALGKRPLVGAAAEPVVTYMQDLADFRNCTIFDSVGNSRSASPEECVGLERAAVWEAHQIEERLLDTFMGRPNSTEEQLRVRLE
jgi:hypothetical protein